MTEQQIIEEVVRYINDKAYNYAVLLDGEWGCGKTYFIRNVLSDVIAESEKESGQARKMVYFSLYGCKSLQDIQENIAWCFVEEKLEKAKDKTVSKWRGKIKTGKSWRKIFRGRRKSKDENTGKRKYLIARKISGAIAKMHFPNLNAYEVLSEWLKMNSYIFVFDDLERCDCPLNEILGYLNGLVEHEGAKLIVVANEKEISGKSKGVNLEKQYEVVLDDRIQWPKHEGSNLFQSKNMDNKLGMGELEERRNWLFPDILEGEYERIREKLIGVTLTYEPNINDTLTQMIKKSGTDEKIQELLIANKEYFISTMSGYEHNNLRTFQFFLSKIKYLLQKIDEINIESEYEARMKKFLLQECFRYAVMFKANVKPPKDEKDRIFYTEEFHLKTVRTYIEKGEFIGEKFKEDVNQFIVEEFKNKVSSDDPFNALFNAWYVNTQKWCEERLQELIDRLNANRYPIWMYEKIIILVARLVELGFSEEYQRQITEGMLKNISEENYTQKLDPDLYFEEEKIKERVRAVVAEINAEVTSGEQRYRKCTVEEVLNEEQWVERLKRDFNPAEYKYATDKPIFSQTNATAWIERLMASTPLEIRQFRMWLHECYPSSKLKDSVREDISVLQDIISGLKQVQEEDIIKRKGLLWTAEQMEELIAPYCSKDTPT